jgi:hypothetical protein
MRLSAHFLSLPQRISKKRLKNLVSVLRMNLEQFGSAQAMQTY